MNICFKCSNIPKYNELNNDKKMILKGKKIEILNTLNVCLYSYYLKKKKNEGRNYIKIKEI
jgi:hypothetical protein